MKRGIALPVKLGYEYLTLNKMTHIKRDGRYLCSNTTQRPKFLIKKDSHIKFSYAHSIPDIGKYGGYCGECIKKYFEILKKPEVVIVK